MSTAAAVRVQGGRRGAARRREVDQLDPRRILNQRNLTILHLYEQGLSMEVVAAIFGLSTPAAYAASNRARERARAIIREDDDGC
jgi:DNA-directed RNA polymerase specialized sigma24 family protein